MFGILVCGDSITHGRGEMPSIGWAGRLKNYFEKQGFNNCLFNLGVPGDTSGMLLKRFETEVKSRVKYLYPVDKFVIIIAVGNNDLECMGSPSNVKIKPVIFKKNIIKLIRTAKKYTKNVVVVGLTPVNEDITNPFEDRKYFTNKKVQDYDYILNESARQENVLFLDIFNRLVKMKYKKLLVDGIHPNSKGYEEMYKIIKKSLVKNMSAKN